ncbi:MAG: FimV family protein [Woeseiaceae bacterium]
MTPVRKKLVIAVAAALGIASAPSFALELGEIKVRSALGERLIAELPLGGDEIVGRECFDVRSETFRANRNLVNLTYNGKTLLIKTTRAVVDPVIDMTITAKCNGSAMLRREYTLFLNPSNRVSELQRLPVFEARRPAVRLAQQRPLPNSTPQRSNRVVASRAPIGDADYLVMPGDSVSSIAIRRGATGKALWPMINQIVADNPKAFIDGNPDRLLAGATLALPVAGAVVASSTVVAKPGVQSIPDVVKSSAANEPPDLTPPPASSAPATSLEQQVAELQAQSAEADRLLALIESREAEIRQQLAESDASEKQAAMNPAVNDNSPFVQPETITTTTPAVAAIDTATTSESASGWTQFLGVLLGLGAAFILWVLWQGRRQQSRGNDRLAGAAAGSGSAIPFGTKADEPPTVEAETLKAPPLAVRSRITQETNYEVSTISMPSEKSPEYVVEDETDSLPFLLDETNTLDHLPKEVEEAIEAAREESRTGDTTIDEQALDLLEADYEFEMTRTQQLQKEVADAALAKAVADIDREAKMASEVVDLDSTLQYGPPASDDTTQQMPSEEVLRAAEEDSELIEYFTNTMADESATLKMPADMDLDFDLTSTLQMQVDDIAAEPEADETVRMPKTGKKSA